MISVKRALKMASPLLRHAINELDVDREAPRINEPINRRDSKGQAELERKVIKSCDAAIEVLPMLRRRKGKWELISDRAMAK